MEKSNYSGSLVTIGQMCRQPAGCLSDQLLTKLQNSCHKEIRLGYEQCVYCELSKVCSPCLIQCIQSLVSTVYFVYIMRCVQCTVFWVQFL